MSRSLWGRSIGFKVVALALSFPVIAPAVGAIPVSTETGSSFNSDPLPGTLTGRVVDAESGEPLPGATVRLRELGQGRATDRNGRFRFENLPARVYTVAVKFVGYLAAERRVEVSEGDSVAVEFRLEPSALALPDVVVTATGRERGVSETFQPTIVLAGEALQQNLQTSLAETLSDVPGLHVAYNGPAAAQPTIRGMGGDRLLVLEDGQRTGDLATTSADHAISIDPLSAERIEVVRGPAGLLYGSNALGGVINVWREDVPRSRPESITGTVALDAESVNRGAGVFAMIKAPLGSLAARIEAGGRLAGDVRTPEGVLPSTDLETVSLSAGASVIRDWGFAGAAYRFFDTRYGVPGTFSGETIPGAHAGGVDIEMQRHVIRFSAMHHRGVGPFDAIELDAHLTAYRHDEIEGVTGEGEPFFGARFAQTSAGLYLMARHTHSLASVNTEGALGLSVRGRDLNVRGGFTGTRPAWEGNAAVFAYEEFRFAPFRLQVGARVDVSHVAPDDTSPIRVNDVTIPVRSRTFGNVSASLAALYDLHPGWTLGASVARAFRSPAIEELFSDGPHLADYSFNIGNPELSSEVGHGADLFLRVTRPRYSANLSVFGNRISNYIYYRPTGDVDPRERRYPVFQADSDDALFVGAEAEARAEVVPGFIVDGSLSYVRGTRLAGDLSAGSAQAGDPLPAIPPLTGRLGARYEGDGPDLFRSARTSWSASFGWTGSAAQRRVPSAIPSPVTGDLIYPEKPTDGYSLLDAGLGLRIQKPSVIHTIAIRARNLTDAVWRDHLSRIKDVAPQPGRSVQLTYRVEF